MWTKGEDATFWIGFLMGLGVMNFVTFVSMIFGNKQEK